ncbi:MAG: hypothetical protein KAJ51_16855 [Thermoplasmata archaeon]|nr:hypothetical protein [Thermoplasmata archaeon]
MENLKTVLLAILVAAVIIGAGYVVSVQTQERSAPKPYGPAIWTCLFYFDGDNNLADYNEMLTDLEYLEKVGSTPEVNLLCLLDRNEADDSHLYYIKMGGVDEFALSELDANYTNEVNMGDPDTLTAFTKWAVENYPAEHYNILLSNHGGGWRGICWDDTSDGDTLDLADLKNSLSKIKDIIGKKVDVLSTVACLVGMVEFAYPLRDYVDYFIGSEAYSYGSENTTEDGLLIGNWQFDEIWSDLAETPTMAPEEFAVLAIEHFNPYGPWRAPPFIPKTESSDTLAVIDCSKIENVTFAADELAKCVKSKPMWRNRVTGVLQAAESYSGQLDFIGIATYTNYDLYDFAEKLEPLFGMSDVQSACQDVYDAVDQAVVAETHGSNALEGDHVNSHGLAIYFPQRETEYNAKYDYIDFAQETSWDEFIKEYWWL